MRRQLPAVNFRYFDTLAAKYCILAETCCNILCAGSVAAVIYVYFRTRPAGGSWGEGVGGEVNLSPGTGE